MRCFLLTTCGAKIKTGSGGWNTPPRQPTLEHVRTRVQKFSAGATRTKLGLRPKQEQLLQLLRDHKSMKPQEIWDALGMTKQAAMKLMQPLLDAGLMQRTGTRKNGRYILT